MAGNEISVSNDLCDNIRLVRSTSHVDPYRNNRHNGIRRHPNPRVRQRSRTGLLSPQGEVSIEPVMTFSLLSPFRTFLAHILNLFRRNPLI